MWAMSDEDFIRMATEEVERIGILEAGCPVRDSIRIRVKKAYPAYFGAYAQMDKVRGWLCGIDNLYCIGRNGQHRYNNMDRSGRENAACAALISSPCKRALPLSFHKWPIPPFFQGIVYHEPEKRAILLLALAFVKPPRSGPSLQVRERNDT